MNFVSAALLAAATVLGLAFLWCFRDIRRNAMANAAKMERRNLIDALRSNVDIEGRRDIARLYLTFADTGKVRLGEYTTTVGNSAIRGFAHMTATRTLLICQKLGFGQFGAVKELEGLELELLINKLAENDEFIELCWETTTNDTTNLGHFYDFYYNLNPDGTLRTDGQNIPEQYKLPDDMMVAMRTIDQFRSIRPYAVFTSATRS